MKKSKYLLITLISFFSFNSLINAAGTASISVNSSSIENGGSVTATVTLKNTAAWNVTITSSGSTSGCTQKFVGDSGTGNNVTKYFSVTCRSTSTGIINFSMSGDITSSDGVNTKISGNKGVTVVTPRPKSTVNYLSSLGVTGGTLSPVFSKDTLEYYVELAPETKTAEITGAKEDARSSVTGIGGVTLVDGDNPFTVVVTAENGSNRTYKLNIHVKELDPIEVTLDSKKYTVVRKKEQVTCPNLFNESVVKYADADIPGCFNEASNITLLLLKNEAGTPGFYTLSGTTLAQYKELSFNAFVLLPLDFERDFENKYFEKKGLKIGEYSVTVYQYKDNKDFNLIYGINIEDGTKGLYIYDSKEQTIQRYSFDNLFDVIKDKEEKTILYLIPLAAVVTILLSTTVLLLINNNKLKKKNNLVDKIVGNNKDEIKESKKNKKDKKNKHNKNIETEQEKTIEFEA